MVGCSPKPDRPSNFVAKYLIDNGYNVIPVSPKDDEILGRRCYPTLLDIPEPVEVVDLFRRSEQVPPHVDEAISIGAKAVWMQQGIRNDEAAEKARQAGLDVVMDRCIKVEHHRLAR